MRLHTRLIGALAAVLGLATLVAPQAEAADLYRLRNFGSGMCLQPNPNALLDQGTHLVTRPCDSSAAQRWVISPNTSGTYRLINQLSGYCADVYGVNADNTPVAQWVCNSASNQRWVLPSFPNSVPKLVESKVGGGSGKRCLHSVHTGDLSPVRINPCNADNAQMLWYIER